MSRKCFGLAFAALLFATGAVFAQTTGGHDIGLGAEDVAKVAPSLAFVNSKGEVEGVKYAALSARLLTVAKTLRKRVGSARVRLRRRTLR